MIKSKRISREWTISILSAGTALIGKAFFAHHHTEDVHVDWKGQPPTDGIQAHIDAMKAYVKSVGGDVPQIKSHPIAFGSGEWTCAVGEFEDGSRMVTVAKWRDGAIAEEYIWA